MSLKIRLLGRPEILDDGERRTVRGHQTWALLARLVLSDVELSRRQLSTELSPDAADPLGSVRWCLAALRRAVGSADAFSGDPVRVDLPPGTEIDVVALARGELDLADVGDLLDGIDPRCGPELETWLLVQRERLASVVDGQLRERALGALASGNFGSAIDFAERVARRRPFDEGANVLLVKSLASAGREAAALEHVASVEQRFRDELGVEASPALRSAARRNVADPPQGVSARAVGQSLLDAGLAAISAGATDAGLDCLRRAVGEAERTDDTQLQGRALLELGTALVHAIRGYDDEGAVLLGRAVEAADRSGDRTVGVSARRELGYVDALAGRRPSASVHLEAARREADDDANLQAGVESVIGFNLADWGKFEEAVSHYEHSLELARSAGNARREAWALGLGSWGLLQAGDTEGAERWSERCVDVVTELRWVSFRPWPLAVLAEVHLQQGLDPAAVRGSIEETFALSCQLADPCWEGATARIIAMCAAVADPTAGLSWIADARTRCRRETDTYVAMDAAILETQAFLARTAGEDELADATARDLLGLAARAHMDHVLDRAVALLAANSGGVTDVVVSSCPDG